MEASDRVPERRSVDGTADATESDARINAYSTSEERLVFTESGNADGWIATDLAVEIDR